MNSRRWQNIRRRIATLPSDDSGATVEWLLVSGLAIMVASAVNYAAAIMIKNIFYRTALVIALPFG